MTQKNKRKDKDKKGRYTEIGKTIREKGGRKKEEWR